MRFQWYKFQVLIINDSKVRESFRGPVYRLHWGCSYCTIWQQTESLWPSCETCLFPFHFFFQKLIFRSKGDENFATAIGVGYVPLTTFCTHLFVSTFCSYFSHFLFAHSFYTFILPILFALFFVWISRFLDTEIVHTVINFRCLFFELLAQYNSVHTSIRFTVS
jgi:hypothetical protein